MTQLDDTSSPQMENKSRSTFSWQTFSIFLSSTFADMHAERDYLKHFVFPRLDEELTKRRIKLNIVDLRWGVNTKSLEKEEEREKENEFEKEEEREKNILKVCLDEINLCHPFFIGLLGDRYGWIPPDERMRQITAGKNLLLPDKGKSVTALEIEFGVLVNPEQIKRSMFYFREPLDYSKFSPEKAALYCEKFDPKLSSEEKEERRISLEKIKIIITEHFNKIGLPENIKTYSAKWDHVIQKVVGLEEWGDKVYGDVLRECENQAKDTWDLLPKNWQEQEFALLEAFTKGHTDIFRGRKLLLEELKNHLVGSNKDNYSLILTGESGSGKSAVFSMICDEMKQENCFILAHSAGLSPRSRNIMALLQIWNKQLSEFLGIEVIEENFADDQERLGRQQLKVFSQTEEKKTGIEKAQDQFRELLYIAAQRKPIVLLIDAIERFEPTERAKYMTWLPTSLPQNVRLLCTAITGTEQKAVEYHKGLKVRSIDQFSKEDAKEMLLSICSQNHKLLNDTIVQTILQKERVDKLPAASSPLWLSLSLKLLLVLDQDDFEKINKMEGKKGGTLLDEYMKSMVEDFPSLPGDLFLYLLLKASSVFGEEFTYAVFENIACSRNGLRENDLKKLFEEKKDVGWDALLFANMRRWFKGHLQEQGYNAQWNLNHSILRSTLLERMDKGKSQEIHQSIADHLQKLPPVDPLRIAETMYHLMMADNPQEAVDYYTSELSPEEIESSTKVLADAIVEDKEGMQWVFIMMGTAENEKKANLCNRFIFELFETLVGKAGLSVCQSILETARKALTSLVTQKSDNIKWQWDLSACYRNLAFVMQDKGDIGVALQYSNASLTIREQLLPLASDRVKWRLGLANSHLTVGDMLRDKQDMNLALKEYQAAMNIMEELVEEDKLNASWHNLLSICIDRIAAVWERQNKYDDALKLRRSFVKTNQHLVYSFPAVIEFQNDLSIAHEHLGGLLFVTGNKRESLNEFQESLAISKRIASLNPNRISWKEAISYGHLKCGEILSELRDFQSAQQELQNALSIAESLVQIDSANASWQSHLAACLFSLADMYAKQLLYPQAKKNFEASRKVYQQMKSAGMHLNMIEEELLGFLNQMDFASYSITETSEPRSLKEECEANTNLHRLSVTKMAVQRVELKCFQIIQEQVLAESKVTFEFQPWQILIYGYDDDPRGLYDIPEVRQWCQSAFSELGFLPLLVDAATIQWLIFCIIKTQPVPGTGQVTASPDVAMQVLENAQDLLNEFLRNGGVSKHKQIADQCMHRIQSDLGFF